MCNLPVSVSQIDRIVGVPHNAWLLGNSEQNPNRSSLEDEVELDRMILHHQQKLIADDARNFEKNHTQKQWISTIMYACTWVSARDRFIFFCWAWFEEKNILPEPFKGMTRISKKKRIQSKNKMRLSFSLNFFKLMYVLKYTISDYEVLLCI